MELSQPRCFQTLSRLEHFTRTAAELHISQPSLSKSISNLEAELAFVPVSDDYRSRVIRISCLRDAHRTSCEESFLRQLRAFFREGTDRGEA